MSGDKESKKSSGLGSGGGKNACLKIVIETSLFSPNEEVIKSLRKGSRLMIVYSGTGSRIEAQTSKGVVAGSLVGEKIVQLLRCIKDGYNYIAEVIEINGGNCKIKITHV